MRKNERKRKVLAQLLIEGSMTSAQVAEQLDMTRRNASMALMRYFQWGLLHRTPRKRRAPHRYSLTRKGRLRLEWLKSQNARAISK